MAKRKKYTRVERARKGGLARARKMSARQRSMSARKAVMIRWARAKGFLEAPETTPGPFVPPADSPSTPTSLPQP